MLERPDEKIAKVLRRVVEAPSVREAVEKVLCHCDGASSPQQLAEWIGTDQGLSARVLRIVNSAFYSLREPISSLTHATGLLGVKTVKSLAVSSLLMNSLKGVSTELDQRSFWKHSFTVALAAKRLAAEALPAREEDLYVAGLFHDLGVILMAAHLPEDYALVLRLVRDRGRRLSGIEEEVFGISHAELGYTLAMRWRLPSVVCDCIRYHESPQSVGASLAPETRKAAELLALVDRWSALQGLDFLPSSAAARELPELAPWLELSREELEALLRSVQAAVREREEEIFASAQTVVA